MEQWHASVAYVSEGGVNGVIDTVCDRDTFVPWVFDHIHTEFEAGPYADELEHARQRTGHDEAVVVGECLIRGNRVALIISDFDFLAGSVGVDACDLVIAALHRAEQLCMPVLAAPASGGTRMQEGTAAFVLMANVAAAVGRFRQRGNLLVVWLRNPTTGGVLATWGSLGTITVGDPGALVGFLGPRVFEMLHGEPFPSGVQTTENLAACGVIDQVVALPELRGYLSRVLAVTAESTAETTAGTAVVEPGPTVELLVDGDALDVDPWEAVLSTRRPERPGVRELLAGATDVTELFGTGEGEQSDAVVLALARFDSQPCLLIGQDRATQGADSGLTPAALRTARRGIRIAAELGCPIVTVIDTAGAELSVAAEESALAGEIARCLVELTTVAVPTVSVLLGMGCGGGALALLPADRVLAAKRAWLSPLPLEGASVIRYRTPDRAPQLAREQQVGAASLAAHGIVDLVIAENPDAADEPAEFVARVVSVIGRELVGLHRADGEERKSRRASRYGCAS